MRDSVRRAEFTALYDATYADLIRFARRRAPLDDADDAVAETLTTAWRRFHDLPDGDGDRRAWLFGTCRHVLLNARRSRTRQGALAVRLADTVSGVDENYADIVANYVDVGCAWQRLEALHQETLCLSYLDDLTAPEAAQVLGITSAAFRRRLSRARNALRRNLDDASVGLTLDAATEGSLS